MPDKLPLLTKSMPTSITKIPEGPLLPVHQDRSQLQLLPEEGGDLLAARFSSGRHSSQVDISVGILLVLQPEEEVVKTIEGVGHIPKADFKATQGHPWATAGCIMTFHSIDTFLLFGYCFTRGRGFFSRAYSPLLEFLTITNVCDFLSSFIELKDLKRIRNLYY